ncbi:hypothetical protein [Agarilytica rhodophyticola]|uniref:hypothetical protein n=1 Tax=Agarilytica rhodophyticola TaxID=1737490 RepID=UPI000B345F81|nr:hypothetical protein [Agarilytica rhodophyticola]
MKINNKFIYSSIFSFGLIFGSLVNHIYSKEWNQNIPSLSMSTNSEVCDVAEMSHTIDTEPKNLFSEKIRQPLSNGTTDDFSHKSIADINYEEALNNAMTLTSEYERSNTIGKLLADWASLDLDEAFEWLSNQKYTDELDPYFYHLIAIYIDKDFDLAGDLITMLPGGHSKRSLADEYTYKLAQSDPYLAINWSENIYENDIRQNVKRQLLYSWVDSDPSEVLNYVLSDSTISNEVREQVVKTAAARLSEEDHHTVISSIAQYPQEIRPQIAYGLIEQWIGKDANAALHWIESLERSPTKDQAIQSYISYGNSTSNRTATFALAESIEKESSRIALMSQVFEQWYFDDPNNAEKALSDSTSLNEEQKTLLLGKARINSNFL